MNVRAPVPILGDLDADGDVDLVDRDLLIQVLLGRDAEGCHATRADLDESGMADARDVQRFVEAILNSQ